MLILTRSRNKAIITILLKQQKQQQQQSVCSNNLMLLFFATFYKQKYVYDKVTTFKRRTVCPSVRFLSVGILQ